MGVGKSTVGRAAAHKLGYAFLDSDHEIEANAKRSIADIFAKEGEPAFRALEKQFIETGHPAEGQVVACGGGLIVQPGMLELVRSKGVIICLHASLETILQRVAGSKHRPLAAAGDDQEARMRALFEKRDPIYRQAGVTVLTDSRPFQDIVAHVLRTFRREAPDWLRKQGRA